MDETAGWDTAHLTESAVAAVSIYEAILWRYTDSAVYPASRVASTFLHQAGKASPADRNGAGVLREPRHLPGIEMSMLRNSLMSATMLLAIPAFAQSAPPATVAQGVNVVGSQKVTFDNGGVRMAGGAAPLI